MWVALTGCSGFIGSFIARALKARGHAVRGLIRKTSRVDHLQDVIDQFVVGEHDQEEVLHHLVKGVDAVIHNSVDWKARNDPRTGFESNLLGSLKLLELTRKAGIRQFLFVSSVAAVSEISEEWGGQITETHPTWPTSLYGAYKAAVESYLKAYHHSFQMNTSAWRPAAVYGIAPEVTRSQWSGIIHDVRSGNTVDIPGGGKITHVQDVADALALAVGDETVSGEFFNLVDRYIYWQEVAEIARELTGSEVKIVNRKGTGPKNQFDCTKSIAFFDRYGNHHALRRGLEGVREYVRQLLQIEEVARETRI